MQLLQSDCVEQIAPFDWDKQNINARVEGYYEDTQVCY